MHSSPPNNPKQIKSLPLDNTEHRIPLKQKNNFPGVIVDEDFLTESCQDTHFSYGHRLHVPIHHHQTHPLTYVDSGRSETSCDEATTHRQAYRDTSYHGPIPNQDRHYRILDLESDGIQVMGEIDLQHLPEAVNREILKNSREIIFEEPETSREGSPLLVKSNSRRNIARHALLDEDKKFLSSSKRNLYHKNILRSFDEDKRSLNGSRKNLTGSRKYLLIPLDGKEASTVARRHTGSRERLNALRRNVKGSKETFEQDIRSSVNSNDDRLMIEMEKTLKSPRLQEILLSERNRTSLSDPNLSPSEYVSPLKSRHSPIPAISPMSDASPESGFYEGTQWSSSPEYGRKDLRVPNEPVITRNRRSYENAQLQDVNEALSRPNSDNSSLNSEESTKNDGGSRKYIEKKQAISYTSV